MSEFAHSIVLFSGDDGLPLEFNIQNTVEKIPLRAMIEHGGGLCTLDADAIHLVSPGTSVINVGSDKTIISSRYIFDCVRENYLFDMEDYKIKITEVEASDFSEENSLHFAGKETRISSSDENSIDIINSCKENSTDANKTVSPNELACAKSNHAFDFESTSNIQSQKEKSPQVSPVIPVQTTQLQVSTTPEKMSLTNKMKFFANDIVEVLPYASELHISSTPEGLDISEEKQKIFNEIDCVLPYHSKLQNSQTPVESKEIQETLMDIVTVRPYNLELQNTSTPERSDASKEIPQTSDDILQVTLSKVQNSSTPEIFDKFKDIPKTLDNICPVLLCNSNSNELINDGQKLEVAEKVETVADVPFGHNSSDKSTGESSINAVIVSSSQPNVDGLDQFDNMLLNKLQRKPVELEDETSSQSNTVSSSADAQMPSSKPSPYDTSAEIFDGSGMASQADNQFTERQQYIKDLEKEIEKILQKPAPKSVEDKAVLVKYICCIKKLAPAIVLQTLQNF